MGGVPSSHRTAQAERRTRKPRQHLLGLSSSHRRLIYESLETRNLLSVDLAPTIAGNAAQQQTVADLPAAAQQSISSIIGHDQSAYHATPTAAGASLANPAHGFTAQLQAGALRVSVGSDTWDMVLSGLGYGGVLQPVGTAQTSVNGNRVDCNYGTVDQWYLNGPAGLEQGFDVTLPTPADASALTLQLALGGDLKGAVTAAGDGLTLTRPDGSTVLGYSGLTAFDATGKALPATLELCGEHDLQDLLIHVNVAGAQGPITIDPFVQSARLTVSGGAAHDFFGSSVAVGGNTVVVGAPGADNGQGAAYIFNASGSGWANMTQTAKLTASDGATDDSFGSAVSISGNTVVVGAPGTNNGQGTAYVFTKPGAAWKNMTETARLTASDGAASNSFGTSISIIGSTVVVGAPHVSHGFTFFVGAAYVFIGPGSTWTNMTQTAELTASDGAMGDTFGQSVALSGNSVVVGAPGANNGQGAAYVFTRPGAAWTDMTQTAKLTASDAAMGDALGGSVSISGSTVAVGASSATVSGHANQGAAYVFTRSAAAWTSMTQTAKLTASDGAANDAFGSSVSISGSTVEVGAPNAAVGNNGGQGAAYLFTKPAAAWTNMTQTDKITAADGALGNAFGVSVSIVGSTILVGANNTAIGSNQQQGAAYVFATSTPLTLTVAAANWTSAGVTLTLGSDGNLHVYQTGTVPLADAVPPSLPVNVTSIDITSPVNMSANLTIDSSAGDPVPAGNLSYRGAGGLTITGSGVVTLSAANTYTGQTTVASGILLVTSAGALPAGGSLTVGAGGVFGFASSAEIFNNTRETTSASSAAITVSSIPVASAPAAVNAAMKPTHGATGVPVLRPSASEPMQPHGQRSGNPVITPTARALALQSQAASRSDSSDQQRKHDVAILALDTLFARYRW